MLIHAVVELNEAEFFLTAFMPRILGGEKEKNAQALYVCGIISDFLLHVYFLNHKCSQIFISLFFCKNYVVKLRGGLCPIIERRGKS